MRILKRLLSRLPGRMKPASAASEKTGSPIRHKSGRSAGRTVLFLVAAAAALAAIETGLRCAGGRILRQQEDDNLRFLDEKAVRILCLGESTTMRQYPRLLEEILNARGNGKKFAVIDKGIGGTNTGIIVSRLPEWMERYRPHAVVTMMGINDAAWSVPLQPEATLPERLVAAISDLRLVKVCRLALGKKRRRGRRPAADPGSTETVRRGNDAFQAGDWKTAESFYRSALAKEPADVEALVGMGRVFREVHRDGRRMSRFEEVESQLMAAVSLRPDHAEALMLLGEINRLRFLETSELDRAARAESFYTRAREAGFNAGRVWVALGDLANDRMDRAGGERFYLKAIEDDPDSVEAARRLAWLYSEKVNSESPRLWREAAKWYARAARLNPLDENSGYWARQLKSALKDDRTDFRAFGDEAPFYWPVTVDNYRKTRDIVTEYGARMICASYPLTDPAPLTRILGEDPEVVVVDNKKGFQQAVAARGYWTYFQDRFAGNFGHCTPLGNQLLAENIAKVILRDIYLWRRTD
jgi:tetratricopeptide (TPR) repeat protein